MHHRLSTSDVANKTTGLLNLVQPLDDLLSIDLSLMKVAILVTGDALH